MMVTIRHQHAAFNRLGIGNVIEAGALTRNQAVRIAQCRPNVLNLLTASIFDTWNLRHWPGITNFIVAIERVPKIPEQMDCRDNQRTLQDRTSDR